MTVLNPNSGCCFYPSIPPQNEECPICYSDKYPANVAHEAIVKHAFHEGCLKRWTETRKECPNCRVELLNPFNPSKNPLENVARTTRLMNFIHATEQFEQGDPAVVRKARLDAARLYRQLRISKKEKQKLVRWLAFQRKKEAFKYILSQNHGKILLSAVQCKWTEVVEEVLQKGAVKIADSSQALLDAIRMKQTTIVCTIIQNTVTNKRSRSEALIFLLNHQIIDLIPPLLNYPIKSSSINRAIEIAALKGTPEILSLLVQRKEVLLRTVETTLRHAAHLRNWQMIPILLKDREISPETLEDLRLIAVRTGQIRIIDELNRHRELSLSENDALLQEAVCCNQADIVGVILRRCSIDGLSDAKKQAERRGSFEALNMINKELEKRLTYPI